MINIEKKYNNASSLFISTFRYPYGPGEQFLANEMPYLAEKFDRIEIQPMTGDPVRRPVPENVTVHPPLTWTKRDKLKSILRGALSPITIGRVIHQMWAAKIRHQALHRRSAIQIVLRCCGRADFERSTFVRNAIAASRPKVAYAYWGSAPADAAALFARNGLKSVVRLHRVDLYKERYNRSGDRIEDEFHIWHDDYSNRFSRISFISQHGLDYFSDKWGAETSGSTFVLNRLGVDDAGCTPKGRNPNTIVIVSCSRIAPVKRVHLIAQLAIALSEKNDVEWHHFGAGQSDELDEILSKSSCANFRYELHGHINNIKLREFYVSKHVDLFVNLSLSEGIPVSIMEAISANVPVLATSVDGNPEVVIDGKSGILCTPDEATRTDYLVAKVSALLDGDLPGLDPRSLWKDRFDAEKNYSDFADSIYKLAVS